MAESKLGDVESELGMWNLHSAFDSCYLVARRSEQRDRPARAERPVVITHATLVSAELRQRTLTTLPDVQRLQQQFKQ
ncbi:MAG: hypothetical protein RMM98_11320 [Acidobacteriota bacterium]|nr:hypothetical protein [Blastocatellia bacterium]MDW8240197.1 hypothetical protein [Acidobacteriota bacterium]